MKKILTIVMLGLITGFSVDAQNVQKQPTVKKHRWHKPEKAAQNFKVCKYDAGYYICDETPGAYNATHTRVKISSNQEGAPTHIHSDWPRHTAAPQKGGEAVAPESQSFPENIYTVYGVGNLYKEPHYIVLGQN